MTKNGKLDEAIENIVAKYLEYKSKYNEIDNKLNKYKALIKDYMKDKKTSEFSTPTASIQLQKAKKMTISKKGTPLAIWNQYARESNYEILNVKKKK